MTVAADPTKPPKILSRTPAAERKRKQRERQRADKHAKAEQAAGGAILHTTEPIRIVDAPERFASIPIPLTTSAPPPDPEDGTPSDPTHAAAPEPPPKPETSAGEAKLFGQALSMYFQAGNQALFAKHPQVPQAFAHLAASMPKIQRPDGTTIALTPDQAYAALCAFVAGCGERVALKYNLRIPYLDEVIVVAAIGCATYGFVPKKKPKNANVTAAKDANPKTADSSATSDVPSSAAPGTTATPTYDGPDPVDLDAE